MSAQGVLLDVVGRMERFGGVAAVNTISLDVEDEEILGIIGPSGAGKATRFGHRGLYHRCWIGVLSPRQETRG